MLRARFAYFKVFKVSSALVSAGLTQATTEKITFYPKMKEINYLKNILNFQKKQYILKCHTNHHSFAVPSKRIL